MIKYPERVDLEVFYKSEASLSSKDVKYGLPQKVRFCKKCVESNQRPSTTIEFKNQPGGKKEVIDFSSDGICSACLVAEDKKNIDWVERERQLKDLCEKYRRTDGSYDCVVPGSGGKDSIFVAHELKYKYGMHPLTVTWAPHIYTKWGRRNHDKWIHSGQDNILVTPNGKVHRLLTRLAVDVLFHPFQPFILGQKSIGPRIAAAMNIPLVFYGEHEAEYGSDRKQIKTPAQGKQFFSSDQFKDLYISGVSVGELMTEYGIDKSELALYMPLMGDMIKDVNVHYFGYYRKWHPQAAYYYAVEHADFEASPERTAGTYSKYSSIDDKIDDLHYYTTGIKFGRGRATEDAAQEIRSGEITREEGLALVRRYDIEYPKRFESELFDYLSIYPKQFPIASKLFEEPILDSNYFTTLSDHYRSPHLWTLENGEWKLRHSVWSSTS
jgi:N-acetyl sugar amidotransferase